MSESSLVEAPLNPDFQPVKFQSASVPGEQPSVNEKSPSDNDPFVEAVDNAANPTCGENEQEFLRKLPPEIGTLLMMVGVAGLLLPGVIGTPLVIAGAVVIWPKTFEPLERRFAKNYPESHRNGIRQVKRFIHDLNRRFPESTS